MSVLNAFLIILALTTTAGGVVAGLFMLARRQKERLAAPLMISVCPECGVRFGVTVAGYIDVIDISVSAQADGHGANTAIKSTVISFDCPRCRTAWKYCEGALVKVSAPEIRRGPIPFSWVVPLFKERAPYHLIWNLVWWVKRTAIMFRRGNREEILSFLRQKSFSLYLSWFCGAALWSVIFSIYPLPCATSPDGRRVEVGFVLMILGLISGVVACFRCTEKRFAGIAIAINSAPITLGFLGFAMFLESFKWQQQMDFLYGPHY